MDYIDKINAVLKQRNISQRQLAELVGKPQGTIHNYLSRKTKMDVETLQKMADALELDICELLGASALDDELRKVIYYLINENLIKRTIMTIAELEPDFFTHPKPFNEYPRDKQLMLFGLLATFSVFLGIPCQYLKRLLDMGLLSRNYYTVICYLQKYQSQINDFVVEYMKYMEQQKKFTEDLYEFVKEKYPNIFTEFGSKQELKKGKDDKTQDEK